MNNDLLLYLNLFSALYYVVLIVLLWYQKANLTGAFALIGLIATNCYALVNNALILSGKIGEYSLFFWIGFFFISMFPVFFRAHIYSLLRIKTKSLLLHIVLLVFWGFSVYYMVVFYLKNPTDQNVYFQQIVSGDFPESFVRLNQLFLLLILTYFTEAGFKVFKRLDYKKSSLSNLFVQVRKYTQQFWSMMIFNYVVVLIFSLFVSEKNVEYAVIPMCMNVVFFFILLNLRNYSNHYKFEEIEDTLNNEYSEEVLRLVNSALHEKKMFLESDCSLDKLAEEIAVPKNKISRAINGGHLVSFNDYINSLRIAHAREILADFNPKSDTIEGVGYSSGFNSKASFYRAFKKFTAQTPTQYISSK